MLLLVELYQGKVDQAFIHIRRPLTASSWSTLQGYTGKLIHFDLSRSRDLI